MMRRLIVPICVLSLFVLLGGVPAQETPAPMDKRLVYLVQHGAAKDLAVTLGQHFKSETRVQVLLDAPSNCLLISTPPAVFDEMVKLLAQLDRRPQLVSVDVLIAEVATGRAEDGKPGTASQALNERDLTGPMQDVLTKVEALKKKGVLGGLKRVQLTAVENRPTTVNLHETKPIVLGSTITATGLVSRNISYRNVGTIVALTPQIAPQGPILLDLHVEDTRMHTPEDGVRISADEKGVPIRAPHTITATLKTKLSVASGQAVVAHGVKMTGKSGQAQTLVIVAARVLELNAKPNQ